MLFDILKIVSSLNPDKSAGDYWLAINNTIINSSDSVLELWNDEKLAATESIEVAKAEGLKHLAQERKKENNEVIS